MELPSSKHLPCAKLFENSSQPWQRLFLISIYINVSDHKLAVCTQTSDLRYESLAYITRIIQTGKKWKQLINLLLSKNPFFQGLHQHILGPIHPSSELHNVKQQWFWILIISMDTSGVRFLLPFAGRHRSITRAFCCQGTATSLEHIGQMSSAFSRAPLDKQLTTSKKKSVKSILKKSA